MDELDCTHCDGDGICDDGADPLWSCPSEAHFCHACNGSGKRRDQVIF
jgi:DnaJ-class molecular chaperone